MVSSMVRNPQRQFRKKVMSDINVVPYIDVMLVLLVVFMVTAPLLTQGINIELPNEVGDPIKQQQDPIVITVDQAGRYYLNISPKPKEPIDLLQIQDRVNKLLNSRPNLPVLVQGDTAVPYGEVMRLMSSLQRAGTPNLGLVTEPRGDEVLGSERESR